MTELLKYIIPAVVVLLLLLLFFSGYLKAPPDTAYIISGLGRKRILIGRAGWRVPFFERVDKLSLRIMQVDVKTSEAVPTNEFINVTVDGVANVKISSDPELLKLAAEALLGKPGVVCTPHLGASTPEAEDNCAVMAAQELSDYLRNGNIAHSVNLPEVHQPRAGGKRICIIHKNEPGMISQITALTTEAGLNIENMVNKSKKNMAYTMLDATGAVDGRLAEKLAAIPAVIRVRIL